MRIEYLNISELLNGSAIIQNYFTHACTCRSVCKDIIIVVFSECTSRFMKHDRANDSNERMIR